MKRSFVIFTTVLAMGTCLLPEGALHAEKLGALVVKAYGRSATEVGDVVATEDGSISLIAKLPADAGSAPVTGKGKWKVETVVNMRPFGSIPDSSPMREEIRGRLLWPESGEVDYMTLKLDHWGRRMADGSMSPKGMNVATLPLLNGLFWKCPWEVTLPGVNAKGYVRYELRIDNECLRMIGVKETAKRFLNALKSLEPADGETVAAYWERVYQEVNPYNDLGVDFAVEGCEFHAPGFESSLASPETSTPYEVIDEMIGLDPTAGDSGFSLSLELVPLAPNAAAWRDAAIHNTENVVREISKWLSDNDCDKWR